MSYRKPFLVLAIPFAMALNCVMLSNLEGDKLLNVPIVPLGILGLTLVFLIALTPVWAFFFLFDEGRPFNHEWRATKVKLAKLLPWNRKKLIDDNSSFEMHYGETDRGFLRIEFKDASGQECSIQESSRMNLNHPHEEEFIDFGINKPQPLIPATEAQSAGIASSETVGWIQVPQPNGTFINGRMHLNTYQAKKLAVILQHWAETRSLI